MWSLTVVPTQHLLEPNEKSTAIGPSKEGSSLVDHLLILSGLATSYICGHRTDLRAAKRGQKSERSDGTCAHTLKTRGKTVGSIHVTIQGRRLVDDDGAV